MKDRDELLPSETRMLYFIVGEVLFDVTRQYASHGVHIDKYQVMDRVMPQVKTYLNTERKAVVGDLIAEVIDAIITYIRNKPPLPPTERQGW